MHDARTTLPECVQASLLALANGEDDPAGTLNHGLEALDVLVRMVEEARQVAASLYWEHDIEERARLLAHSAAQPAWLVDSETDLLTLTPPSCNAVHGDLPEQHQP